MNSEPTFVDTWGWMALGRRGDARHSEIVECFRFLRSGNVSICTGDYVLGELITLLFRRELFQQAVQFVEGLLLAEELGQLTVFHVTSERFVEAWELRKRFQDKPQISFTDLSSMALIRERGIKQILTDDDHFLQVGLDCLRIP